MPYFVLRTKVSFWCVFIQNVSVLCTFVPTQLFHTNKTFWCYSYRNIALLCTVIQKCLFDVYSYRMLVYFVLDRNATFSNSCWNSGLLCTRSRQLSLIFTVLEVNFVLAAVASGLKSFFLHQYKVEWNVCLAFKINKIVWNLPQGDHQFLFWRNGFAHIGISLSKSRFKQFQQLIKFCRVHAIHCKEFFIEIMQIWVQSVELALLLTIQV